MDGDSAALEAAVRSVCREAGLEPTGFHWLPAALSLRRFARVTTRPPGPASLVARVEVPEDPAGRPEGVAAEPPHEPIRALLERHGLPVPRRFGGDAIRGIDLLEDAGDRSLTAAVEALRGAAAGDSEARVLALYHEACALVPRIQTIAAAAGVAAFERRLDAPLFAYKADLVVRHGLTSRGRDASSAEASVVRRAFARIAEELAAGPQRLAHRDLQSSNLLVREASAGPARLCLIDLQGAFLAPPEYDLVCLLRDSYVELPETTIATLCDATRPLLPDAPDAESFARRFDLLTLTRKGKDYARFLYAARERGDHRFERFLPTTLRHLRGAARRSADRDPAYAELCALIHELPETPCAR